MIYVQNIHVIWAEIVAFTSSLIALRFFILHNAFF